MNKNHSLKKALLDSKISQVGMKGEKIQVTERVDIVSLVKKGPYFMKVDGDSTTRLINLWPSVRTFYPTSFVNAPFYRRYSKLPLHGTEESRNKCRSNDEDRTGDPSAQEAAH